MQAGFNPCSAIGIDPRVASRAAAARFCAKCANVALTLDPRRGNDAKWRHAVGVLALRLDRPIPVQDITGEPPRVALNRPLPS